MPGKSQKSGNKRGGFTTTFVNYKLSNQEKAEFVKFAGQGDEKTQHAFVEAMGKGNKFSVSLNDEKGFYLVAMTCRDEGSVNYDFCITSRSPDWWEAVLMCVFKAHKLGYDQSWADMSDSDDWG